MGCEEDGSAGACLPGVHLTGKEKAKQLKDRLKQYGSVHVRKRRESVVDSSAAQHGD